MTRSRYELSPAKIVAGVGCFTILSIVLGAAVAIYPAWLEHHRRQTGWLPSVRDIEEIHIFVRPSGPAGEWSSKSVPLSTAPTIVALLARRQDAITAGPRSPPGRLVQYDYTPVYEIELKTSDLQSPIRITATRWGMIWINGKSFIIPSGDTQELEKLVLDQFYENPS